MIGNREHILKLSKATKLCNRNDRQTMAKTGHRYVFSTICGADIVVVWKQVQQLLFISIVALAWLLMNFVKSASHKTRADQIRNAI